MIHGMYEKIYDKTYWRKDIYVKPNVFLMDVPIRGRIDFVSPTTAPATENWGATINTVTADEYGALTNGWYDINPVTTNGFGAKLMFSNVGVSGDVLYSLGLRARTKVAGTLAVGLNVSASAAVAASGQLLGGEFYLQNSGSYTITGVYQSTALHVKSWLQAACSPSASALWIDDESSTKATAQHMVDITMNGSIQLTDVFRIYGGDPGAAALFEFNTCNQGSGAFLSTTASGGATRKHRIACTVDGVAAYMSLYTD